MESLSFEGYSNKDNFVNDVNDTLSELLSNQNDEDSTWNNSRSEIKSICEDVIWSLYDRWSFDNNAIIDDDVLRREMGEVLMWSDDRIKFNEYFERIMQLIKACILKIKPTEA